MNYGNPHQNGPTSFLPPLGNRGMGRERREPVKMYPGGPPRSDRMYPGGPPRDPQMRPMTAMLGDNGNVRPRYDKDGKLIQQRTSGYVPFDYTPIMDYRGSQTASNYYGPGYKTEMDMIQDPFRETDPGSLLYPENPYDNPLDASDFDMYQGYGEGPLYFS